MNIIVQFFKNINDNIDIFIKNIDVGGTPAIFNNINIKSTLNGLEFITSFKELKYNIFLVLKLINTKNKLVKDIKYIIINKIIELYTYSFIINGVCIIHW